MSDDFLHKMLQSSIDDFLTKHKDALDKGRETVRREQNKSYFS